MPSLELMEAKLIASTEVLTQVDRRCDEVTHQQAAIEVEIQNMSKRLHEIIDKRQKDLIGQLSQITKRKLHCLATQRAQVQTIQIQLTSCLEFTKESLKAANQQCEVLSMKEGILTQVQELINDSQPSVFTITTEADTVFSASTNAEVVCRDNGSVYSMNSPDPSKCVATGKGTEEAVVGEEATAILHAVSLQGNPCKNAFMYFEAEFVSEIPCSEQVETIECACTGYKGQGQYVISYQPTVKGRHQLHIRIDGDNIRGSPFSVTVKLPVEKLGTQIQALRDLANPRSIAVSRKGEIVVTEWGAHRILVFDSCGVRIQSFSSYGQDQVQFNNYSALAIDSKDTILLADPYNHQIQRFTLKGKFCHGVGSELFAFPHGIAYSAIYNKVYIVDSQSHSVQVLNSDLTFFSTFGRKGSGRGQFKHPHGIAIGHTGRVYIADSYNYRIQVFTAEGVFLRSFGKKGQEEGSLDWPAGVAVDVDHVYVSEHDNHRVSVFTTEGEFVKSFGRLGSGPGEFCEPCGLAVDSNGVVYVCDSSRVQMF